MTKEDKITMADLTAMSVAELKSLEGKVAKAIETVTAQERQKAIAALQAKAKELGYSLDELIAQETPRGRGKGKPRTKGVAKYANPANPSQTWTGKGRRPGWVLEALQAGKSLDDLAI
ncbi:H-NS histone family protein [Aquicoccus porphyridii]|nr:H-NS histone family protein [Aquicoccus porphyridii]